MDERTMGIIYAVKKSSSSPQEAVRQFMSNYSGVAPENYTEKELDNYIELALCDCLNDIEFPSSVMREFFHFLHSPWDMKPGDAAACAIQHIRVKRFNYETQEYEYINGFKGDINEEI